MTTALTWRYLVEYARRPLNLVLLAVVPVVFVALSWSHRRFRSNPGRGRCGPVRGHRRMGGGLPRGVAGFFHVSGSRS
jgi:hypothetical protein